MPASRSAAHPAPPRPNTNGFAAAAHTRGEAAATSLLLHFNSWRGVR
jgi:hypothetical protein